MKKTLSLFIAAAMILSTMVSVSAAEVSTTKSTAGETATYYFYAPESYYNTEAGAANDEVGIWFWGGETNPEGPWPGPAAEAVGDGVFKAEIPADTTGLIFNAHVDGGAQTANIDVEDAEHDGEIYVLDLKNGVVTGDNGAAKASGDWFSLDPKADNYYKNSDNFATYAADAVETPDVPAPATPDVPTPATPDVPTEEMATYYFYAPDSYYKVDAGAANDEVGIWFWGGKASPEGAWPGPAAEAVGDGIFKAVIGKDQTGLIFNAHVDGGAQTANIDVEDAEHDGEIYVLDLANVADGENPSGAWFSMDEKADNYFKNSYNFKTYSAKMATYYFLAPDSYCNTEKGAANADVGVWFWGGDLGMPAGSKWPGPVAKAETEIGENVFSFKVPYDATGLIFNAHVDAGDPADPVLAAVAHQTKNIEDVEDGEHDGMIYVLDLKNDVEIGDNGAAKAGGAWFSLDPTADNYYKNSANYATYKDATDTPDVPAKTEHDVVIPTELNDKSYKAGDEVIFTYKLGNIDNLAALNAEIAYNAGFLEVVSVDTAKGNNDVVVVNTGNDGKVYIGATFDAQKGTSSYAKDAAQVCRITFKAKKDLKLVDLGVKSYITYLLTTDGNGTKLLINEATKTFVDDTFSSIFVDATEAATPDPKPDPKPDDPEPKDIKIGDVTGDGKVDSEDALKVLRYSVDLENFDDDQKTAADVNKDNVIDSEDSLKILRKSVGYDDKGAYFN